MSTDASSRPNDLALCHQIMESQQTTIAELQSRLMRMEHSFEQLLRSKYGPRSERVDPHQLDLFDQQETGLGETDDAEPPPTSAPEPNEGITVKEHQRRGGGRNVLPDHLPRETVEYDLSDEEKCCPGCGETRQRIGSETSEQWEFVPAPLKVIEHVRFKSACRTCQEHVAVAPPPHKPINKGRHRRFVQNAQWRDRANRNATVSPIEQTPRGARTGTLERDRGGQVRRPSAAGPAGRRVGSAGSRVLTKHTLPLGAADG